MLIKKGFVIPDDNYFDLFEGDHHGLCAILADNSLSPLKANGQEVYVLVQNFKEQLTI